MLVHYFVTVLPEMPRHNITYSDKYYDDVFEYRCVCSLACYRRPKTVSSRLKGFLFWRFLTFLISICWTRHVILPPELAQVIPKKLMSEQEWRSYVRQHLDLVVESCTVSHFSSFLFASTVPDAGFWLHYVTGNYPKCRMGALCPSQARAWSFAFPPPQD